MPRCRAIASRRPFWFQMFWTRAAARDAVPLRSPWRYGWGAFFLSAAVVAVIGLPCAAGLVVVGVSPGVAVALGLVAGAAIEFVLDRVYRRISPGVFPPPAGGDPAGDFEPRKPLVLAGSAAASVELPIPRRWEDEPNGA